MITIHRLICTCFGIGLIPKGGGTVAASIYCIAWYFLLAAGAHQVWMVFCTLFLLGIGIWSSGKVEISWGKDSPRIVIDEIAGMSMALLFIPYRISYFFTSFILFRIFDIAKPFFIRRLEKWPRGFGVMGDDLLAGIYTNLVLQSFAVLHQDIRFPFGLG